LIPESAHRVQSGVNGPPGRNRQKREAR